MQSCSAGVSNGWISFVSPHLPSEYVAIDTRIGQGDIRTAVDDGTSTTTLVASCRATDCVSTLSKSCLSEMAVMICRTGCKVARSLPPRIINPLPVLESSECIATRLSTCGRTRWRHVALPSPSRSSTSDMKSPPSCLNLRAARTVSVKTCTTLVPSAADTKLNSRLLFSANLNFLLVT